MKKRAKGEIIPKSELRTGYNKYSLFCFFPTYFSFSFFSLPVMLRVLLHSYLFCASVSRKFHRV